VVPFENSSNGSVVFTLDLFADTAGKYPDILVQDEIYLPVHHCLVAPATDSSTKQSPTLAKRQLADSGSGTATPTQAHPSPQQPRVKPSGDLSRIKRLYSHPQAWGQCKIFLSAYFKGIERQDVSSTSKAAELVANDESGTSAAISSRIAGELNGLDLLAEGIEDVEGNSTRFFVIRRKDPDGSVAGETDGENEHRTGTGYKTLVSFTVHHTEPGALADCLAVFKRSVGPTVLNTRNEY
jgi:prephenate dehydratase